MALQEIFTGMEKGPEAIDANFKLLAISGPTSKTRVNISGVDGVSGYVDLMRKGGFVFATGSVTVTKLFSDIFLPAAAIPNGYKNNGDYRVAAIVASWSHREMGSWVFNKLGGLSLTTNNATKDDMGQFSTFWPTDDDFPA